MGSMDELRSPSLPTRPAAPVIVFPSPSMLSVLQLLGTIRCPKKPRAAQPEGAGDRTAFRFERQDEVAAFSWMDRGLSYVVTAKADRARLLGVAEAVYQQLDQEGAVRAKKL